MTPEEKMKEQMRIMQAIQEGKMNKEEANRAMKALMEGRAGAAGAGKQPASPANQAAKAKQEREAAAGASKEITDALEGAVLRNKFEEVPDPQSIKKIHAELGKKDLKLAKDIEVSAMIEYLREHGLNGNKIQEPALPSMAVAMVGSHSPKVNEALVAYYIAHKPAREAVIAVLKPPPTQEERALSQALAEEFKLDGKLRVFEETHPLAQNMAVGTSLVENVIELLNNNQGREHLKGALREAVVWLEDERKQKSGITIPTQDSAINRVVDELINKNSSSALTLFGSSQVDMARVLISYYDKNPYKKKELTTHAREVQAARKPLDGSLARNCDNLTPEQLVVARWKLLVQDTNARSYANLDLAGKLNHICKDIETGNYTPTQQNKDNPKGAFPANNFAWVNGTLPSERKDIGNATLNLDDDMCKWVTVDIGNDKAVQEVRNSPQFHRCENMVDTQQVGGPLLSGGGGRPAKTSVKR